HAAHPGGVVRCDAEHECSRCSILLGEDPHMVGGIREHGEGDRLPIGGAGDAGIATCCEDLHASTVNGTVLQGDRHFIGSAGVEGVPYVLPVLAGISAGGPISTARGVEVITDHSAGSAGIR